MHWIIWSVQFHRVTTSIFTLSVYTCWITLSGYFPDSQHIWSKIWCRELISKYCSPSFISPTWCDWQHTLFQSNNNIYHWPIQMLICFHPTLFHLHHWLNWHLPTRFHFHYEPHFHIPTQSNSHHGLNFNFPTRFHFYLGLHLYLIIYLYTLIIWY